MRLADFFLKLVGYRQEKEMEQRQLAELIRLQTVEILNIQIKKSDRIKKPSDLWQFPWETKTVEVKKELVTEQEQIQRINRLLKSLKK